MTITKSKFKNSIPEIRKIALRVNSNFGHKFEIDELVNESWIRGEFGDREIDIPILLREAYFRMIDYTRFVTGRKYRYDKDGVKKEIKLKRPKYLTNLDTDNDEREPGNNLDSFLDMKCSVMDEGCEAVDNKDLMDYIISESEPTTKQAQVLRKHFLEGKTLGEVGKELGGIKECTVSTHKKRAIARCRKRFKSMEMLSL